MSKLVDYFSTFWIGDDEIAMRKEVADAQQAALDRQLATGNRSLGSYLDLTGEVQDAATAQERYRDANDDFLKVIPWWFWLVLVAVVFWYLGGFFWLKGILARK